MCIHAKKAGQKGMFMFYCVETFVLYHMVVNFVSTKISLVLLSFLFMMIINEASGEVFKVKYSQCLVFRYKNINLLELVKYPVRARFGIIKYPVSVRN